MWVSVVLAVVASLVVGGAEPGSAATVVTLSSGSYPSGFTVPAGQVWRFDPNSDVTITSGGNVVVLGTLEMKPANGDVEHVLQFTGINESNFQGGGIDPLASDVGLWVTGAGKLDTKGETKPGWSYAYEPSWDATDEVRAAPNTPNNYSSFPLVSSTPAPNALGYSTELLNLTRNVRIEGTPTGYSHVFIRSAVPSSIRYTAFRYVGPNPGAFASSDSTGRYGLHFHHNGDASRGTLVEGVVVRDTANHAFVPHGSHGITFRDVIAYNVRSEAVWWDDPAPGMNNETNDVVFDRALVALVSSTPGGNNHRLTGFYLGAGSNPTVVNSVAVGMQQELGGYRSGFLWPEKSHGIWVFHNNRAHNNESNGIFVWQNNSTPHVIDGFTAYYNDQAGVEHGAYRNAFVYQNLVLLQNGVAVISHALGKPGDNTDTQVWSNITTGGGTLYMDKHARPTDTPVRFQDCDFGRVVVDDRSQEPGLYDFVRCGLEPSDFDLTNAHPNTIIRVQRADKTAYQITGNGTTTITAFANTQRYAGSDRYATAVAISQADFAGGASVVFVATGTNFPDALAGAAVAGKVGAPILLTRPDSLPSSTAAELVRLKPSTIVILGGPAAVSTAVETALQPFASSVVRRSGANRYATAASVSQYGFGSGASVAFLATGTGFADALAGGPAAVKLGGPVLLTDPNGLPAATAAELVRLGVSKVYVLGGPAAVSDAVVAQVDALVPTVQRVSGANRYATAVAISQLAFDASTTRVYTAVGTNFPDALAGGAAAGKLGAPMLLVQTDSVPSVIAAEITRLAPDKVVVLGGTAVISNATQAALLALID